MMRVSMANIATTHCLVQIPSGYNQNQLNQGVAAHLTGAPHVIMAARHFSSQLFMDVVQDATQKLLTTVSTWCSA